MNSGKLKTFLTTILLMAVSATAAAHAELRQSAPQDKARVAKVEKIELSFSDTLQLTALTLQRGSDTARKIEPLPAEWASDFSIPVPALAAGDYVVTWSASTDDGHTATGKFRFTVTPAQEHSHQP